MEITAAPPLDRLTRLACAAVGAPIAVLTTCDGEGQTLRSQFGLDAPSGSPGAVPPAHSLCARVVASGEALRVSDARGETRGAESPTGAAMEIVAYAGVPLQDGTGRIVGTLSLLDTRPRSWTDEEIENLRDLAAAAERHLNSPASDSTAGGAKAFGSAPEEFRLLVESVRDYAILMLDEAGRIASWNAGAERIKGYAEDEVLGRHFSLFYTPADVERRYPEYELEVAAREGRFEDEGWRVRKDGSRFWANVVITALRNGSGALVGYARVTRDLTERRRAELELEDSLGRERQARLRAEELAEELRTQAERLDEQSMKMESQLEELQKQSARLQEAQVELEMVNEGLERANAELTAAEAHYRRLVDTSPSGVFVLDAQGRFTEFNASGAQILGRSADDPLGGSFTSPIVEEDRDKAKAAFLQVISGQCENLELELWVERRTGERRLVHVMITAVRENGAITGVHGVMHDITEARRTQDFLRESEASYRSLFDNLAELVYIMDMEGHFLNANEAVLRRYGYSRDEIADSSLERLIDPARTDAASVRDRFIQAARGEPQRFELWGRTREGESFPNEVTFARGRHFGEDVVIAVARDITQRKEAEMAVARSRDFYMSIFDRFPALIWRSDASGACDYFNEAWLEFTGRSLEQEIDQGWADGVHPEDQERRLRTSRDAFAAREPFEMEYRLRHRSGEYRWIRDLGRPVHSLDGAFIGYIGGAFDIDLHRRTEEQLRQAQKMEAVGRIAGGIAHDFNNVLLVIQGNAQLALMDLPPDARLRQDLEEIDQAAERAAKLTRQLLSFSRQQVLQPRVVDLNVIISNVEKMLRRTLGEDIEFVSVLDPELGRVRADPGQVEQILMNLAVNARDAMPTGGKLITETRNFQLTERFAAKYRYEVRPGPYVMLTLSDTGTGMSEEVSEHVFEPFFTTKPQGQGTGLGLSTVYGIVKQSGGYIWVQSEEGRGSTFTILLPREDAEPAAPVRPRPEAPGRRTATVLLVEDEVAVRATARRMLEHMGHTVLEAENGEQGLRVAEDHGGSIDLLLTDVVMPLMGGRELAERLTARWPAVRVLYTSGYTDEAVVRHGVLEGSASFLQKPYEVAALAEKIAEVLDGPQGPLSRSPDA